MKKQFLSALSKLNRVRANPKAKRSRFVSLKIVLLRKEVIQPHLPIRLPCYDFTPITSPTLDGSLLKG